METLTNNTNAAIQDSIAPSKSNAKGRDLLRDKVVKRELKKAGFKAKIRAFCCHCIFDPYQEGSWLKQVKNCTSYECPLYSVRPVSHSKKALL